jgi:hypothetical protein
MSPESGGVSPPSTSSRADAFLSALWSLSPKVLVLAEQEASHNAPALTDRFVEALSHYAALFDCLEAARASSAGCSARRSGTSSPATARSATSASTAGRAGWRAPASGASRSATTRCCRRGGRCRACPATASTCATTTTAASSRLLRLRMARPPVPLLLVFGFQLLYFCPCVVSVVHMVISVLHECIIKPSLASVP